jgi:hypothetical protein
MRNLGLIFILVLSGCSTISDSIPGDTYGGNRPYSESVIGKIEFQNSRLNDAIGFVALAEVNKRLQNSELRILGNAISLSSKTLERAKAQDDARSHCNVELLETAEEMIGLIEGYLDLKNLNKYGQPSKPIR